MSLIATAPASRAAPGDLGREGVGGERHAGAAKALDRRQQRRGLGLGGDRGAAAGGDGADVEHLEAGGGQLQPVGDRPLGSAAAGPGEHRVGADVDDPGGQRLRQLQGAVGEAPVHVGYGSGRVALRCVYTDLDGTLLGAGRLAVQRSRRGLLDDAGARAGGLPPGRGRGRDHVRPPRAPGPRGRPPDRAELLHLRGGLRLRHRRRDDAADRGDGARRERHDLRADRVPGDPEGALRPLRGPARVPLPLAHRPRPLPPLPRLRRRRGGQRAAAGARRRRPAPARQRRDRPRDGGDRGHPRLPPGAAAGQQGRRGRRPRPRPRLRPGRVHRRSATRSRTSRSPRRSAPSSSSPTGPSATRGCGRRSAVART